MTNPSKLNPISGKLVSYKFIPTASQLMLTHPDSIVAKRGKSIQELLLRDVSKTPRLLLLKYL
jgi:Cu2+-containing amine oxidase